MNIEIDLINIIKSIIQKLDHIHNGSKGTKGPERSRERSS